MTGLQISQFCFLFILNSCTLLFLSITPTEPEHKQEHIVLERSARLNLDPAPPTKGTFGHGVKKVIWLIFSPFQIIFEDIFFLQRSFYNQSIRYAGKELL